MRDALETAGYAGIPRNGLYPIGGMALGKVATPLKKIIRDLRTSKQAADQLVDALVLRGYLDRTVDADDRRKLTTTLTERGKGAAATQAKAREKIDVELQARVGKDDVAAIRRTLAALIDIQRDREAGNETPDPSRKTQ